MASNPSAAGNNKSGPGSSSRPALNVTPLNSMPYIGGENAPLPTDGVTEPAASPSFMILSTEKSPEELKKILDSLKGTVVSCGSAATAVIGPHLGKMNISESNDSYRFIVALPGVITQLLMILAFPLVS